MLLSQDRLRIPLEGNGYTRFETSTGLHVATGYTRVVIGINVGDAVVGNIGSEVRAKYGIVGSAVNITNRIQAESKGGQILVSESVHRYLKRDLRVKSSFEVRLKGVKERVTLFEIEGFLEDSTPP